MMRRTRNARAIVVSIGSAILAVGIGVAIQTTSAAWTDEAYVNAGPLGGENDFDIALIEDPHLDEGLLADGGVVRQADGAGAAWALPGADTLVPGQTLTAVVGVFNNSTTFDGDVEAFVERSVVGDPDISGHLQISVVDLGSGEVLIDQQFLDASGKVQGGFALAPRAGDSVLGDGDAYTHSGEGTGRVLEVRVHYSETDANGGGDTAALNGGKAHLRLVVDAVSR